MLTFEKLTIKESIKVCSKDVLLTTTPKEYVDGNYLTVYTLVNTWYLLISEYAPISAEVFLTLVKDKGLIFVIKTLSREAEKFVKDERDFLPFSLQLMNELLFDGNWQQRLLLLLRFGKRYSPVCADKLSEDSIKDFIQVENRTKLMQRRPDPAFIYQYMREEILSILGSTPEIDSSRRYFSSGACYEGNTLYSKLEAIAANCEAPWGLEYTLFPTRYTPIEDIARIQAVPKSYKAARIIAEEEAYRQYENTAVYLSFLGKMQSSPYYNQFCITDQEKNRSLCREASITGSFATLDLSHASDCNSKQLTRSVYPPKWVKVLFRRLTKRVLLPNGKVHTLQMFSTSGSVLTFCVETLTFWSIARTAKRWYEDLTGEQIGDVSVYGDDMIVPTEIAELTMELLTRLGFEVNQDKSFYTRESKYRETCGAEFLNGYDVASKYWPRKELKFNQSNSWFAKGTDSYESITSLVALQQALYQHTKAGMFLASVVRAIIPDFTSSNPNELGATDLFEVFPLFKEGFPPHKAGTVVPDWAKGELHYCSEESYPKVPKHSEQDDPWNYDIYRYQNFLKHGPRFEDPLLELLGVSSPDAPFSEVCNKPTTKWRKKLK